MAKRLFSFPYTAENEAEVIRKTLTENNIAFYQTPGSRWGFSNPAIWITIDNELPRAKELFTEAQKHYAQQARENYQQDTGYNPNAPFKERTLFSLKYMLFNKKSIPLIFFLGLIIYFYYHFFSGLFETVP